MNVDEQVELDGNKYYRIICILSENKDAGKWLAQIRVIRKDTGEYIKAGFTVFDYENNAVIDSAKKRISDSLLPELEKMGAPSDWGSEIRNVLMCCTKLRSTIFGFGSYTTDTLSTAGNEDKFRSEYASFWKKLIKETIELSGKIEALSDEDRIQILVLPEDAIKDPSDSWSLEEIDARIMVFDFFLNPTDEERQVHAAQKKKLADRFNELGW